jgi:hypothetical protein
MVLSKMYCSEQIVIPEKISNLLKTYAKGKNFNFIFTQPMNNNRGTKSSNDGSEKKNALKAK